jgi:hypothetical protein
LYSVFLSKGHLRIILPLFVAFPPAYTGNPEDVQPARYDDNPTEYNLATRLSCFHPVSEKATYFITLCADIPVDDNPDIVYRRRLTGHVFLILEKRDPLQGAIVQVFGYYPVRQNSSLFFNNVRSKIKDNSGREYNASVTRQLTVSEFQLILEKAAGFSKKKYNLNKFNCYDYALTVFNAIPGIEKIPVGRLRYPFIFGKGGTPCVLYKDLKSLREKGSAWATAIKFGEFKAPASYTY